MRHVIGWLLMAAGIAIVLAGRAVHAYSMPELTEPQALKELWYFWAVGSACSVLGFGVAWPRKD